MSVRVTESRPAAADQSQEHTPPPSPRSSSTASPALLDLHRIRQFAAVAEHLSFTTAARELHLCQQTVSGTVKSLERDVGLPLFERVGGRIQLTPSGTALRDGALSLLDAAAVLARTVRAVHDSDPSTVTVAYTPDIVVDELLDLVPLPHSGPRTASVVLRQIPISDLGAELRSGRADVALSRNRTSTGPLECVTIGTTPLRIAVSATHRLAKADTVALRDLRDDTLLLPHPPSRETYSHYLMSACRQSGFEPTAEISQLQDLAPTLSIISTDHHYAFVTAAAGHHHNRRVRVLDLTARTYAPVYASWLPHTTVTRSQRK
ncbi:LysR family transcriptional regulator [Rhodococcus sp. O3]|uniref:LysR family transcriptional regulator n=1 Tax=Rhodococcus sp. O3 TaxID=3404919 RepID=UPI003B6733B3